MSAGRAFFVTGIVIGATTGFTLGHLALWGRCPLPESVASSVPRTSLDSPLSDSPTALSELDPWNPLGAMTPPNGIYYAPVSDSRDANDGESLPIDVSPPSEGPAPPSLLPPPNASPLGVGINFDLKGAIEREVPDASPEQVDVWLDVLKGLNEEDAVGILRMWQLHGNAPLSTAELLPLESSLPILDIDSNSLEPSTPESDPLSDAVDGQEVISRLREITLHNIANAQTPGYRSLTPVVSNLAFPSSGEAALTGHGIRLDRVTLCIDDGPLVETGEQWDVAIRHQPSVFFKVRESNQVALTRYGHLEVDDQDRLCIAANGRTWPLNPPVTLPPEAALVRIEADGRVLTRAPEGDAFTEVGRIELCQVHSPQSLEPMGDRLYRITQPLSVSAPSERFELAQGLLEGSNVDLAVERDRLAWLDELSLLHP